VLQIKTHLWEEKRRTSGAEDFVLVLAGMLKDPSGGNIEFVFAKNDEEVNEDTKRLYAFQHALKSPAFEYKCTFSIPGWADH